MRVLAVTGGIACGKSTVTDLYRSLGAKIIDADAISHELTRKNGPVLPAILQEFGQKVFTADLELDRAALARAIFADRAKKARLEAIMHPRIRSEMLRQLKEYDALHVDTVVLDIPLLFECNMQNLADIIICCDCPREVQIARLQARDGLSEADALRRIESQMPASERTRRSHYVIDTDRPMEETQAIAREIFRNAR